MFDEPDPLTDPPETVRVPDNQLDDLAATVGRLVKDSQYHGSILERLTTGDSADELMVDDDTDPANSAVGAGAALPDATRSGAEAANPPAVEAGAAKSMFILAFDGPAYLRELDALKAWVHRLLLTEYGREISTSRHWCFQWHEHPEAVARLHALWLAWQQLTDVQAGLTGPSTWHREHLDPALLQLRAPDGPFAACTTNANRPNHRLLPTPAPTYDPAALGG